VTSAKFSSFCFYVTDDTDDFPSLLRGKRQPHVLTDGSSPGQKRFAMESLMSTTRLWPAISESVI
jgi:hypothetical protein